MYIFVYIDWKHAVPAMVTMKWKGKWINQHVEDALIILMIHSGVSYHTIQRTVLASNTDSLFRQSVLYLYLPLGFMGPYFDFVKILPGEEVCSQALGSRSLKLQASHESIDTPASKESFACFPHLAQKPVWHSSTLKFLLFFIFDNLLPVRTLGGS